MGPKFAALMGLRHGSVGLAVSLLVLLGLAILYSPAPPVVEQSLKKVGPIIARPDVSEDVSGRRFWAPGEAGDEDPKKRVPHRARGLVEAVAAALGQRTKRYAEKFTVQGSDKWSWNTFPTIAPTHTPTQSPAVYFD